MPVATATMTRIQKLFRRPSSPRKGQSGGGGAWDETKYGGRTTSTTSRTSSSGSIESMGSLDTSFRSRRPSSEPKPADRVTWADAPTWIDPPASYDFTDPAELWWTAAERREQLARTEWLVALETKRKLRDELRPPIPGESRRGLGVACEPSTPAARAAKIASHRRAIVAASRDAAPDGLARFAAHLSVDAVAAAVARLQGDRSLELFDVLLEPSTPPFGLGRRWTRIAAKVEGLRGVKASHGEDVGERILSRLGRLVDYARQPFQITLWADADTAFCDAGELVRRARLLAQLGAYDVRLAEYDLVKVSRTPGARDAHVARLRAVEACGDAAERLAGDAAERDRLAAEVKCWDEPSSRDASSALPRCPSFTTSKVVSDGDGPAADGFPSSSGLQGGVILSKNTKGARNFFKAWVDAWLDAWSPPLQKKRRRKDAHRRVHELRASPRRHRQRGRGPAAVVGRRLPAMRRVFRRGRRVFRRRAAARVQRAVLAVRRVWGGRAWPGARAPRQARGALRVVDETPQIEKIRRVEVAALARACPRPRGLRGVERGGRSSRRERRRRVDARRAGDGGHLRRRGGGGVRSLCV
mmetsp:Transcript_3981/g.12408  ORF Transcript_3981/g.12408 Transcript_3981/m.12408 type:complete len:586 (+) Transcript_3981:365-2122(+)